ncbi:MAG: hypothetical protein JWM32_2178 [Verrucomicrobia bacterium]|nr:hypothetical protein [Verrucomicrobiota bacterium]
MEFPALTRAPTRVTPKAVVVSEHATCFFHAQNEAESVCESCGRMLCAVCTVEFSGRRLCPSCIALARKSPKAASTHRVLYGGIALSLAILPLFLWPFTAVTAPLSLGFVIFGWRKPGSLVGGGRARLIIAGMLALMEIAAWIVVLAFGFTRHR